MVNIAENIRQLRLAKGYTQAALAKKMGIHRQRVTEWENGSVSPTGDSLIKIANALDIKPAELLRETR